MVSACCHVKNGKNRKPHKRQSYQRPVSNFSLLSKLLERIVPRRLQEFLDRDNLMPVKHSQPIASTTARRRLRRRFTTTNSWLLIRVMSLPRVCLIWLPPSTLLTMTFWCFDLNGSLVSAVSSSSGSVHICRTATGWMFLSVSSSSSEWPFIGVYRAVLLNTSWTAASLRLMLPVVSGSAPQLIVPRHRRTKFDRRAFSVAGPTARNSLPDYLRDSSISEDTYRRSLKTYLFALYQST